MVEKLRAQGYFPELRYLTVLRELSDAEGQLAETQTQLESAQARGLIGVGGKTRRRSKCPAHL